MDRQLNLLLGTLDVLILKALALGQMHGWGISLRIQQVSKNVLRVAPGSLYPALHRLERQSWIASEWRPSKNNRRAKYYSLTKAGLRQLEKELTEWERTSSAIGLVLKHVQELVMRIVDRPASEQEEVKSEIHRRLRIGRTP